MSEYTPTISELREAWLSAEFEERDSTTSDDDLRAEFDRALAAHDAEVRAGVVAEEPEWEYGYELIESDTRDVLVRSGAYEDEKSARNWASRRQEDEDHPDLLPLEILIVRRRKAGPWVPIAQEGTTHAS